MSVARGTTVGGQQWQLIASLDDLPAFQEATDSTGDLPHLVHFIWLGSPPSNRLCERINSWASLNPTTRVLLWRDAAVEELLRDLSICDGSRLLRAAQNPAAASDVARFAILRTYGGIYLDTDMEACRPIGELFDNPEGFVVRESRWSLVASALGLPAGSLYARIALEMMEQQVMAHATLTNHMSGPPLITELRRAFQSLGITGPVVLEPWTFFPDNPFRFPRRARSSFPPYGIHLFMNSWSSGGEFSLIRRLGRLSQPITPRDMVVGPRRQTQLELRKAIYSHLSSAVLSG